MRFHFGLSIGATSTTHLQLLTTVNCFKGTDCPFGFSHSMISNIFFKKIFNIFFHVKNKHFPPSQAYRYQNITLLQRIITMNNENVFQICKNKTNHPISSNSHPSATAKSAIFSLKIGGGGYKTNRNVI